MPWGVNPFESPKGPESSNSAPPIIQSRPMLVPVDGSREVYVCCKHFPQPKLHHDAAFATRGYPKFLERRLALLSGYLHSSCSERAEWLAVSLFIGYKAYASAKKTLNNDGHRHPRGPAD